MFNELAKRIEIMKRVYNQPNVEVLEINSGELMQGLTVSVNSGGGGGGTAGMPGRKGDIIP